MCFLILFFVFFSSRRRHTRFKCDWSSDVCSSDLPRRASALFMRLTMRERSLTRLSRSRFGRLASSSSIVGIATIPQCPRSPRNQPRNTRINIAASRRSVFARLRSRDTATLAEWMTCASIGTGDVSVEPPAQPYLTLTVSGRDTLAEHRRPFNHPCFATRLGVVSAGEVHRENLDRRSCRWQQRHIQESLRFPSRRWSHIPDRNERSARCRFLLSASTP